MNTLSKPGVNLWINAARRMKNPALQVSFTYFILSAVWILAGDFAVEFFFSESIQNLIYFQSMKGLFFVGATSALLFWFVNRHEQKHKRLGEQLEGIVKERTASLYVANEELAASNKQLQLLNNDLAANNDQLQAAVHRINEQAQIIARQKDEQLNRVLDNSQDAIFSLDLTGNEEHYYSRSSRAIFGQDVGSHLTDKNFWYQRTHPEDREIRQRGRERLAKEGHTEVATRMMSDDGTYHWIFERHRLIFKNGIPVRQEGIASDISSLKEAERKLEDERKQLERSEANLKAIFENTEEVFILLDDDFKIRTFNSAFYNIWLPHNLANLPASINTISKESIIGRSIFDFVRIDRQEHIQKVQEAVKKGERVSYLRKYFDEKIARWDKATVSRIKMPEGKVGYCISILDQTEIENAREALRFNEERFRALVENSDDLFAIVNDQMEALYVSPNVKRILGYSDGELVGCKISEIIHPEDAVLVKDNSVVNDFLTEGVNLKSLRRVCHKKGHWLWMEETEVELKHTPGVQGRVLVFHDVTEKKERELCILELNKSLADFQNAIYRSSIVSLSDKTGCLLYVNQNFMDMCGYAEGELIGQNHRMLNSGHHSREFWAAMWGEITQGNIWRGEVKNRRKDGSEFWVDTFIMPFLDEQGNVREYLSIRHDITERKAAEEILREYNERFEIVSKATNDAIWDWDVVNEFEVWNHGLKTIFGYDEKVITNPRKWWREKIHPDDFDRVENTAARCFQEGLSQWSDSYRYLCADGTYKYVLDRAHIIYQNKKPVRMIGAMQDITEIIESKNNLERKVEERTRELNEALKKEKELADMKSRFVSIASHEFRTPLAAISIASGAMKKFKSKMSEADIDKKLESIDSQVDRMTWLLNDVLTIGKSEAGKIEVSQYAFSLRKFIDGIIDEVRQITKNSHVVNLEWEGSVDVITSDENLWRNIFINLLTNAIKFSPGESAVCVRITSGNKNLKIEVCDQGVGIPAEDIAKLFQSFQRGSNVSTIRGTGLGLSIVKKAVELLKGEISIHSKLNEGSTFIVSLPMVALV